MNVTVMQTQLKNYHNNMKSLTSKKSWYNKTVGTVYPCQRTDYILFSILSFILIREYLILILFDSIKIGNRIGF